jgi:hypothetical protein
MAAARAALAPWHVGCNLVDVKGARFQMFTSVRFTKMITLAAVALTASVTACNDLAPSGSKQKPVVTTTEPAKPIERTPPPTETELDGTYLRTLTLRDVGGARIGLPFRCLRRPPYRIDAGVSTIIFTRGAFYLHHQMSGFKTHGSFVVEGDRVILFNDANCPQERGVYAFEIEPHGVRFDVIHDDCPWSGERADDLMAMQWTHVHACVRWIQNLWPGAVAC